MDKNPNKYHISDDGKVYEVLPDGSIKEKGNIEELLNATPSKPKKKRVSKDFFIRNWSWLSVIAILLIFILFGGFIISYFPEGTNIRDWDFYFFWIFVIALGFVIGTWFLCKKHIKQIFWIYFLYALGVFSISFAMSNTLLIYYGMYEMFGIMDWRTVYMFCPAIIYTLWAYSIQKERRNK